MATPIAKTADGCLVTVKVTPRASRTECLGAEENWVRVRLQAPPVDNKANEALVEFFADLFSISKHAVTLVAGATSRVKRVALVGITPEQAAGKLRIKN